MRLFGDILPFLGFRLIDRAEFTRRGYGSQHADSPLGRWEVFEAEWLGHGFTFAIRPAIEEIE